MNLGTARVAIIVVLAAAGIGVLASGFSDPEEGATAAPPASGSPSPGVTPSTTTSPTGQPTQSPEPQVDGVLIAVLNGTDATGLAGEVQDMLVDEGYTAPGPAGNAPIAGIRTTTVYYRGGENQAQNQADATYLAETFFEGAEVGRLGDVYQDVVGNTVTVVVVVGQEYADSVAA